MAVTPLNYTRKDNIQVVSVQGDLPALQEIRDWLISELGTDANVELTTYRGTMITFVSTVDGVTTQKAAYNGDAIIKDSQDQFFTLHQDLVSRFYDRVV